MSTLRERLLWKLLQVYSFFVSKIKNISKVYKKYHNQYLYNTITDVRIYDVEHVKAQTLYHNNLIKYLWYRLFKKNNKRNSLFAKPGDVKSDTSIKPIYEVRCWDSKRYLVRDSFDINCRKIDLHRHKYVCVFLDKIEITSFINNHVESFTESLNLNMCELIQILFLSGNIDQRDFVILCSKLMLHQIELIATNGDDLLEIVYKHSDIIIL